MKLKIWTTAILLLFSTALSFGTTNIEVDKLGHSGSEFALSNYPNPFNPLTIISFQLSAVSTLENVELTIFNMKGQKVRTFSSEDFQLSISQDRCSVTWDGRDAQRNAVTSGIYFYKLKIGNERSETKKMILLR